MARGNPSTQRIGGFTLVEVLIAIVVIGIAAVTLTSLSLRGSTMSAQALRDQQALALATAMLNEATSQPFTYCDPSDDANINATSVGMCAVPEVMGREGGETRGGVKPLDNVSDYNGLVLAGATLTDALGSSLSTQLPQLASCTVRFTVAPMALGAITLASGDALRVTVTADCQPGHAPAVVEAVRVRYAPTLYKP